MATLSGGTVFSKIDLASAYQQVLLDDESKHLLTIKTHRAFLGLVNYYGHFLPNHSTVAASLYRLLRDNIPREWKQSEQRAFEKRKDLLTNKRVLVHYAGTL